MQNGMPGMPPLLLVLVVEPLEVEVVEPTVLPDELVDDDVLEDELVLEAEPELLVLELLDDAPFAERSSADVSALQPTMKAMTIAAAPITPRCTIRRG